ncbi:Wadjet anti-phage system protein JetD domain-containing protein [uncultured Winogradskyella sp.]|uniref:Wadjet anti-phage system protein JetD domain-containing protein n=1 Tax=uncultured Winogradskyella sp. TaxID=395353 RepID=UPI00263707BB|nr:Wadjet anti-phage system protein JetD domain-containing protein [uncultured Winogradskyella sp.]
MNWTVLKSLSELYHHRKVQKKTSLENDSEFCLLLDTKEIRDNDKFYVPNDVLYNQYYEKHHLENFDVYYEFLEKYNLLKKRFEEEDIKKLIELETKNNSKTLIPSREQLIEAQETVRGFSTMFFKHDKYLDKKDSLINAINDILDIKLVENKDQQYLYVLQCDDPQTIVLCENLDFLKKDKMPRANNIELWYAGGRNVKKLKYADTRGIRIFYSGDWDKDGLEIFELAKEIIPEIELLFPTAEAKSIEDTDHKSLWKHADNPELLSGLNKTFYPLRYQEKIKSLIKANAWIVEESNDLKKMIESIMKNAI